MRLFIGGCDRKLGILFGARLMQARNEIARQERTICSSAENPGNLGPVGRRPVEGGENAGERSRKIFHRVGNDGQAEACKPCRIAIGVENESVALRLQPRDHAFENGAAADLAHRLFFPPPPPPPTPPPTPPPPRR